MIRPAGAKITGNGTSDGVVPFCKIYDSTILATNQGSVRRGAASVNINIEHDDFEEWLEIREPKGDVNRQSLNLHQCAVVENLKEMSTDNRLIYISAQLWVISLCDVLNKEMRTLEIDGVNFLENEKQLENRTLCLKEMLTNQIQKHTKKMV
jgi:ribonucleoside-diphosphate reductase alpha chain